MVPYWKHWVNWYIKRKPYLLTEKDWVRLRKENIYLIVGYDKYHHPCSYFNFANMFPDKWKIEELEINTLALTEHNFRINENRGGDR